MFQAEAFLAAHVSGKDTNEIPDTAGFQSGARAYQRVLGFSPGDAAGQKENACVIGYAPIAPQPLDAGIQRFIADKDGMIDVPDGLSTALFVMGFAQARVWANEQRMTAVIVDGQGKVFMTPGCKKISLASEDCK